MDKDILADFEGLGRRIIDDAVTKIVGVARLTRIPAKEGTAIITRLLLEAHEASEAAAKLALK